MTGRGITGRGVTERGVFERGVFEGFIADAIRKHRAAAPYVRLVAAALPPRERLPWMKMADALATGDVAAGIQAADTAASCWIPLVATPAGDGRLEARILQAATRPPRGGGGRWSAVVPALFAAVLALLLLLLLATTVLPLFEVLFDGFGMQLPWLTRMTLAIGPAVRGGWQPLLAAMGLGGLCWWFLSWHAPRRAALIADFTQALARLVAGGLPDGDAIALAARVVAVPASEPARPVRPLTYAAVAALEAPPAAAAVLLDAVAACHDDRTRNAEGVGEWFLGPLAIVAVGLLTAVLVLALFLPLVQVVSNLS